MGVNRSKKEKKLTDKEVKNQLEKGVALAKSSKDLEKKYELDIDKALKDFEEKEPGITEQIRAFADTIDLKQIDKIMAFGSEPLIRTYEQSGKFLKESRGSDADQKVIKDVLDIIDKANKSYEEFNLTIKEPNAVHKALLKIFRFLNKNRIKKIDQVAITNYNLLEELRASSSLWLENLEKSMDDIYNSFESDKENVKSLEKYLIAGNIALPRLKKIVEDLGEKAKGSGFESTAEYEDAKNSLHIFEVTLSNLNKQRLMYYMSGAELRNIRNANIDTRVAIKTQVNNNAALISQLLRNAILNENNREAIDGQKALTVLNEELMQYVAESIKETSIDAKKILYTGNYNLTAIKTALKTVIDTGSEVRKIANELLPKMQAENEEINELIKELQPEVAKAKELQESRKGNLLNTLENNASLRTKPTSIGDLKF